MPSPEMPYSSDDDRWRAVSTRDAAADGLFLYGVRTTRIYCRPNCKARLARRANVVYFADMGTAEAQGYRACKRCKPAVLGAMPDDAAVARIRSLVAAAANSPDAHGTQKRGAELLATQARVSRWHFHRKFKQVTGMTPRAYRKQREAEAAAQTHVGQRREGTVEGTAESIEPASTLPALPLDDSDWFAFDSLVGMAGPDDSTLDGEAVDFGNIIALEEYLDGIDPCLLHSSC